MTDPERAALLEAFHAADDAWQAEIVVAARAARAWPGDYRFSLVAEALPSYPARKAACLAWLATFSPAAPAPALLASDPRAWNLAERTTT